jgi:hypothetical protein
LYAVTTAKTSSSPARIRSVGPVCSGRLIQTVGVQT